MKKVTVGLMSILILAGIALAGQAQGEKKGSAMGGMMEQMMGGGKNGEGGMGGMMGMMRMMEQMSKMMDQCSAMMESMHKEAAPSKKPEEK